MPTCLRSYSKINLGLAIGQIRPDGFHALTTLYQTIGLHDLVTVSARPSASTRITLTTNHPYVPRDQKNTGWRMVERCLRRLNLPAEVEIHIEKILPVQGGLGAGSANAAAALIALEHELGLALPPVERLHLASEIGSDVPLFLLGGAVLGTGRGEQVTPVPDLPRIFCLIAVPAIGISTPAAFQAWDTRHTVPPASDLTSSPQPDKLKELSLAYSSLSTRSGDSLPGAMGRSKPGTSGIVRAANPEKKRDRPDEMQADTLNDLAENPLLALVRTGIGNDASQGLQNDFEEVVFPQYPSLRTTKRLLMGDDSGSPAVYAALSGSGSALFGLYRSEADAKAAQQRVQSATSAIAVKTFLTETLPRAGYWDNMFASVPSPG